MGDRCPFYKFKPCRKDCMFYRSGIRYYENNTKPTAFEDCAISIGVDNIEQMHNRMFTMQKETGEQKNMLAFKLLSELGIVPNSETASQVVKT